MLTLLNKVVRIRGKKVRVFFQSIPNETNLRLNGGIQIGKMINEGIV
jgi:hypothetical protein